jgi:DNA-binding Xre family transcriptional regulator
MTINIIAIYLAIVKYKITYYNKNICGGYDMIVYNKLWKTMKERGISQYKLTKEYKISCGMLDKLRKNKGVTTYTLDNLCKILNCKLEDIAEYIPDNN